MCMNQHNTTITRTYNIQPFGIECYMYQTRNVTPEMPNIMQLHLLLCSTHLNTGFLQITTGI
jgi:hypothetical protein